MNTTTLDVPAVLACPGPGCLRTFDYMLRIEFRPDPAGKHRLAVTPHADAACLSIVGHFIAEHGVTFEAHFQPGGLDAWIREQVWASAHAANFTLGEELIRRGFTLRDDGGWDMP